MACSKDTRRIAWWRPDRRGRPDREGQGSHRRDRSSGQVPRGAPCPCAPTIRWSDDRGHCVQAVTNGLSRLPGCRTSRLTCRRARSRSPATGLSRSTPSAQPSTRRATHSRPCDEPDTQASTSTIGGMSCASCATRIERTLNRLDGVVASVNFATGTARIEHPAALTLPALVSTVESLGYTAQPAAAGPPGRACGPPGAGLRLPGGRGAGHHDAAGAAIRRIGVDRLDPGRGRGRSGWLAVPPARPPSPPGTV